MIEESLQLTDNIHDNIICRIITFAGDHFALVNLMAIFPLTVDRTTAIRLPIRYKTQKHRNSLIVTLTTVFVIPIIWQAGYGINVYLTRPDKTVISYKDGFCNFERCLLEDEKACYIYAHCRRNATSHIYHNIGDDNRLFSVRTRD